MDKFFQSEAFGVVAFYVIRIITMSYCALAADHIVVAVGKRFFYSNIYVLSVAHA